MKRNNFKSLIALGALALSCNIAHADLVGAPSLGIVSNLLGNLGQNLGRGALSGGALSVGRGAISNSFGNLGQGTLGNLGHGALSGNLNGSLNGLVSVGDIGSRSSTFALQGIGEIGGGTANVNILSGNTRVSRSGNAGTQ